MPVKIKWLTQDADGQLDHRGRKVELEPVGRLRIMSIPKTRSRRTVEHEISQQISDRRLGDSFYVDYIIRNVRVDDDTVVAYQTYRDRRSI